jgi:predicted transcriptional regulator
VSDRDNTPLRTMIADRLAGGEDTAARIAQVIGKGDMSTLKLQIEALVRVLQAPSPEDHALTMRKQMGAARRERDRKMALEVLSKGPAKAEKIGEALGLNAGGASQILRGLIKNGLVRNKGGRPATYAIIERSAR